MALLKKSIQLKEMLGLVGSLNFFSKGVPNTRAINRRFYDAMCGIQKEHYYIELAKEIKEILYTWNGSARE